VLHGGQVVSHEQVGQAQLALQAGEQVEHLGLDRHVQRGHRLVADDQVGLAGQRTGDADPLALATRQLVGPAAAERPVEADLPQQLVDAGPAGGLAGVQLVHLQRLGDRVGDRPAGVERGERVLEHHRDPAPHGSQPSAPEGGHVGAVELDAPGGRLDEAQQGEAERGLAAARLAHQAERLAAADLEVDAVDGPHRRPALRREVDGQPLGPQQHVVAAHAPPSGDEAAGEPDGEAGAAGGGSSTGVPSGERRAGAGGAS
jgi:hypothetical protein